MHFDYIAEKAKSSYNPRFVEEVLYAKQLFPYIIDRKEDFSRHLHDRLVSALALSLSFFSPYEIVCV